MDIQAKKLNLIEWVIQLKDEAIINRIDAFRKKVSSYDPGKRMTMEELYSDLEESEKDYKEGRITNMEDLEKESEKW